MVSRYAKAGTKLAIDQHQQHRSRMASYLYDALANRAVYEYDAAGRIARQTMTDQRIGGKSLTVWRYQGARMALSLNIKMMRFQ